MKTKLIALILTLGFLSACSTLKKIKEKDRSSLTEASTSAVVAERSDSTSTVNTRNYKGVTPEIQAAYLKSFEMSMDLAGNLAATSKLSGNTDDFNRAMFLMNLRSNEILDLMKSGVLGYEGSSKEKTAGSESVKSDQKKETTKDEEHVKKEKTPDITMLVLINAAFILILIIAFCAYYLWNKLKR